MRWNWQKQDWKNFTWNNERLLQAERIFLVGGGVIIGAVQNLGTEEHTQILIELMSSEAITTSEIEGEILDRSSVQSSIRRYLGLSGDYRRVEPAENGIAEMTIDVYQNFTDTLTAETLFMWHGMLMNGRTDLKNMGSYRTHADPMQVVSGRFEKPTVHFEAVPSLQVEEEMVQFLEWFNRTAPDGSEPLPALTRAGIAHLYFVSIHPFEDGNGRIARAVAQKALLQGIGQRMVLTLSPTILLRRKNYYEALEIANKSNEVTSWIVWFAGIVLEAQRQTQSIVGFLQDKAQLFDQLRGKINERQEKALLRMFAEGPQGFKGGMSAKKYMSIAIASQPTTTRDLSDLVTKRALIREGELKGTRYHLNIPARLTPHITINEQGDIVEE